jgi:hypothetical protein
MGIPLAGARGYPIGKFPSVASKTAFCVFGP